MDIVNGKKYVIMNPFSIKNFFLFCYLNEIQSVIIEGGKKTLQKFIESGYWDEARVFTSTKKLKKGISSPNIYKSILIQKILMEIQLDFYFN